MGLAGTSATELAALIAAREVSAVEVVEAHLAVEHEHGGAINAEWSLEWRRT